MKIICCSLLLLLGVASVQSQTLDEAKALYQQGKYVEAKPVFGKELENKPQDPSLNLWYGVSMLQTGDNIRQAEQYIRLAAQKGLPEGSLYLGDIYTKEYKFKDALAEYDKYLRLKKRDKLALELVTEKKKYIDKLSALVNRTEDIQIIDSLVVDKDLFLLAYNLSPSSGKVMTTESFFGTKGSNEGTAYMNEKASKVYYSQPNNGTYALFSMEKLLDQFGNEKRVSSTNFGLKGDLNYPFVMPDGVTLYFGAKDEDTMGGYDIFVTRYNLSKDSYLVPERMNMPFNSPFNDYMMAIDEEKGIGWFASDRYQSEGSVCIYTFIPNSEVKTIDSTSMDLLASRARIDVLKDSWRKGKNYAALIALAHQQITKKEVKKNDFTFVVNDNLIYHFLRDFKNEAARQVFEEYLGLQKSYMQRTAELDNLRISYALSAASDKTQMTQQILSLEKETENMKTRLQQLTIQVRNLENRELKN